MFFVLLIAVLEQHAAVGVVVLLIAHKLAPLFDEVVFDFGRRAVQLADLGEKEARGFVVGAR